MAEIRESFATLEDASTQAGVALAARVQGQTATAQQGAIGFAFKDSSGNVVLPALNPDGTIQISPPAIVSKKSLSGQLASGSATLVLITGAEITLDPSVAYRNVGFVLSCRRDALFQIIKLDDAVSTVLAEFVVGAGQYTLIGQLDDLEFTTGATGTQKLQVFGQNFGALSSLRATVTCQETYTPS